jgi:large subunit ribosomal protein L5
MAQAKELIPTPIYTKVQEALGVKNVHATPHFVKIKVNVGMGELKGNEPLQKAVQESISLITGQKPVVTRAKKAIAGFKLRQKDVIGYTVTLRSKRMYDFLNRLITYVFPRIRDFQGFPLKGFDKNGNYSFGLRENTVFPEIPFTAADKAHGLQITIVTSAKTDEEARVLLEHFGFPFEKAGK